MEKSSKSRGGREGSLSSLAGGGRGFGETSEKAMGWDDGERETAKERGCTRASGERGTWRTSSKEKLAGESGNKKHALQFLDGRDNGVDGRRLVAAFLDALGVNGEVLGP